MSEPEAVVRHAEARVRGRYWELPAAEEPVGTWVGFHGYGEDAESVLREMRQVPGHQRWTILSIQALHPFYRRTGDVVASWMTKLDRELAIEDNLDYVSRVIEEGIERKVAPRPFVYLGFSQGTAMAYRAAIASRCRADAVIALAGDVPKELAGTEYRPLPKTLIGRGTEDTWYTEEKEVADRSLLEEGGAEVDVVHFDGGHEWTAAFRSACSEFLSRCASAHS